MNTPIVVVTFISQVGKGVVGLFGSKCFRIHKVTLMFACPKLQEGKKFLVRILEEK